MSMDQVYVTMGYERDASSRYMPPDGLGVSDGPATVSFDFEPWEPRRVFDKHCSIEQGLTFWHIRRWAEQAYTAIHGPRR
jgi:hypothetical protein